MQKAKVSKKTAPTTTVRGITHAVSNAADDIATNQQKLESCTSAEETYIASNGITSLAEFRDQYDLVVAKPNILGSVVKAGDIVKLYSSSRVCLSAVEMLSAGALSAGTNLFGYVQESTLMVAVISAHPFAAYAPYAYLACNEPGVPVSSLRLDFIDASALASSDQSKPEEVSAAFEVLEGYDVLIFTHSWSAMMAQFAYVDRDYRLSPEYQLESLAAEGRTIFVFQYGAANEALPARLYDAVLCLSPTVDTSVGTFGGCTVRWLKPTALPEGEAMEFRIAERNLGVDGIYFERRDITATRSTGNDTTKTNTGKVVRKLYAER